MKQFTEDELKRYIESAREIVKQKGECEGLKCTDCPFEFESQYGSLYECNKNIHHIAAVGFLALYDKENVQEGTK